MNLDTFFEIINEKTEEGIRKLKETAIGTEEYQLLVNQIISNMNLRHDRQLLEDGPQRQDEKPKQFNPDDVIGKEFK